MHQPHLKTALDHIKKSEISLLSGDVEHARAHVQAASAAMVKDVVLYRQITVLHELEIELQHIEWVPTGNQSTVAVKVANGVH